MTKLLSKTLSITKSMLVLMLAFALASTSLFSSLLVANAQVAQMHEHDGEWDVSGDYVWQFNYEGTDYAHDVTLIQDENFDLTGTGGSPSGANTYEWEITSGGVSNDGIDFDAKYTATEDAVTPLTTMEINGAIAEDGTISGTWSDNYQGTEREGTFTTSSGAAQMIENEEPEPQEEVTVTIVKYVDGEMATTDSANDKDFPMIAEWDAENIGAGSGEYSLSPDNETDYTAVTTEMTAGADYSTYEVMNDNTGNSCDAGKPFALKGYTTGNTLAQAEDADMDDDHPEFTNLTYDKYVIVWNEDCSDDEDGGNNGELEGEVEGGTGVGELEVTSIEVVDSTGTADGTFENGWEYVFNITVPTDEEDLSAKFANWARNGGGGSIPAANNMRISSEQADNDGATVLVTGADTYTTPKLHITEDLNPSVDGMQVEVRVEVAIPTGTVSGSYTTSYGLKTE